MKFLVKLFNFFMKPETVRTLVFGLKIADDLIEDKKTSKNIKFVQSILDITVKKDELNKKTGALVEKINTCTDPLEWGPFKAILDCNRHGENNHGIRLESISITKV